VTARALVVDWGGVLTPSVGEALAAWARSEGLEPQALQQAFRLLLGPGSTGTLADPIQLLERGEVDPSHVEDLLAEHLRSTTGSPVRAQGMFARMFAFFTHAPDMTALVWRAHEAGITTALLSNSWGDHYPESLWDGTFDVVVLSGQVGMRKPDPAIFLHTADLLGVAPSDCVFVDDLPHNVEAAVQVGMTGVVHTDYARTEAELCVLLGRDVSAEGGVR
jgi:epoxide hydrolase-like predicted phosphatase